MSDGRARKGGRFNVDHVQLIEEIFAETAAGYFFAQVVVAGRDHAHVHMKSFFATHALKGVLSQKAQESHLQSGRNGGDLVEKQGAAGRLLQPPLTAARACRAGRRFHGRTAHFLAGVRPGRHNAA